MPGDPVSPRRKSLKKSLRESFRRLRNRRGHMGRKAPSGVDKQKQPSDDKLEEIKSEQAPKLVMF